MARIPYPDTSTGDLARVADEVRRTRGTLLNLFRALMHAPRLAEPWLALGTAMRYESTLDDRTRELVICQIAARTESAYEWYHHAPLALAAGVGEAQLSALPDPPPGAFDETETELVSFVDRVFAGTVSDDDFAAQVARRGTEEATEVSATAAFYVAVARFLAAMGVEVESAQDARDIPPLPIQTRKRNQT